MVAKETYFNILRQKFLETFIESRHEKNAMVAMT